MKLTPRRWHGGDADFFPAGSAGAPWVWLAALPVDASELSRLAALLSADERARAERFQRPADRARYTVGRGLLRIFLAAHLRVPAAEVGFECGRFGKPRLRAPAGGAPLQFNLSHSGELVLLAFSATHEVGIDVEQLRPEEEWADIVPRLFSTEEQMRWAALAPAERQRAFFSAWTRREAGLKALGTGLAGSPAALAGAPLTWFELELPAGYAGTLALCERAMSR